ncbi:hypothetical protein ACRAWG_16835 [Methylobacterium sp. P31]
MKGAAPDAAQPSERGAALALSGTPEMPPIDGESVGNPVETPVLLGASDAVHHDAPVDLTTDLLETTSFTALDLPSAGAAEVAPTVALDLARDEPAGVGDAQSGALVADAPAAMGDITGHDQSAAEIVNQLPPATTKPASLLDEQLRPVEAPHGRPVSPTWLPASLTFSQTLVQMNVTAWNYARGECEARLAYLRALSHARTVSQAVDLQACEMTRALEAAVRFGEALAAPTRQLLTGSALQPNVTV